MPWTVERVEPQFTFAGGGTGAASISNLMREQNHSEILLKLISEGSSEVSATIRVNLPRGIAEMPGGSVLNSPSGALEMFSVEDIRDALQDQGLEPISREVWQQIVDIL